MLLRVHSVGLPRVKKTVKSDFTSTVAGNQSINQSKSLINSCQTATEHIHMNCTNKNNDKMQ